VRPGPATASRPNFDFAKSESELYFKVNPARRSAWRGGESSNVGGED